MESYGNDRFLSQEGYASIDFTLLDRPSTSVASAPEFTAPLLPDSSFPSLDFLDGSGIDSLGGVLRNAEEAHFHSHGRHKDMDWRKEKALHASSANMYIQGGENPEPELSSSQHHIPAPHGNFFSAKQSGSDNLQGQLSTSGNRVGDEVHDFFEQEHLSQQQSQLDKANWSVMNNNAWPDDSQNKMSRHIPQSSYNTDEPNTQPDEGRHSSRMALGVRSPQEGPNNNVMKSVSRNQPLIFDSLVNGSSAGHIRSNQGNSAGDGGTPEQNQSSTGSLAGPDIQQGHIVGRGSNHSRNSSEGVENVEARVNYDFLGSQLLLKGQLQAGPQFHGTTLQPGLEEQLWKQFSYQKHLQELQRQQQIQQLEQHARQQQAQQLEQQARQAQSQQLGQQARQAQAQLLEQQVRQQQVQQFMQQARLQQFQQLEQQGRLQQFQQLEHQARQQQAQQLEHEARQQQARQQQAQRLEQHARQQLEHEARQQQAQQQQAQQQQAQQLEQQHARQKLEHEARQQQAQQQQAQRLEQHARQQLEHEARQQQVQQQQAQQLEQQHARQQLEHEARQQQAQQQQAQRLELHALQQLEHEARQQQAQQQQAQQLEHEARQQLEHEARQQQAQQQQVQQLEQHARQQQVQQLEQHARQQQAQQQARQPQSQQLGQQARQAQAQLLEQQVRRQQVQQFMHQARQQQAQQLEHQGRQQQAQQLQQQARQQQAQQLEYARQQQTQQQAQQLSMLDSSKPNSKPSS